MTWTSDRRGWRRFAKLLDEQIMLRRDVETPLFDRSVSAAVHGEMTELWRVQLRPSENIWP